jgi:hypothetical protein
MPERYSTEKSYLSILKMHILPRWGDASLAEVKRPFKVEQWLKELKNSSKTKSNVKGLLHRIFEYAMKWEIRVFSASVRNRAQKRAVIQRRSALTQRYPRVYFERRKSMSSPTP